MLGFFGKIYLFFAGWADGQYLLVVVGLITSVVSIYYYISVIKMMVVKEPQEASDVMKAYPDLSWNVSGLQPLRLALVFCLLVTASWRHPLQPVVHLGECRCGGHPTAAAGDCHGGQLPTG